jgi:hypothetical protein
MDLPSDRRQFLVHALGAPLYLSSGTALLLSSCKSTGRVGDFNELSAFDAAQQSFMGNRPEVKSIRMSATDPANKKNLELYAKAVSVMKATEFPIESADGKMTWWEAHAQIHNNSCPHGNWFFLPWHRAYLHYFELVCRTFCGDESFSLPYWDWSADARLPLEFDSGDEATNPLYNSTRSLQNRAALVENEITAANVADILATMNFESFAGWPSTHPRVRNEREVRGKSGRLENGPHNKVHATIQGDMGAFISPRDPIFWLHHCNVDRLWEAWMAQLSLNNISALPAEENVKSPKLTAAYWQDYQVSGFYSIQKKDGKFEAAPATMKVATTLDALSLGLLYVVPKKSEDAVPPSTDSQGVPEAPRVPTNSSVQNPFVPGTEVAQTVVPAALPINQKPVDSREPVILDTNRNNLPLSETPKKKAALRFRAVVRATIALRPKVKNSFGLTSTSSNVTAIEGSRELDGVLKGISGKQWTTASLRLAIDNVPYPVDPRSSLHFYLNSAVPEGERKNPGYIGSVSFFGHGHSHEGATVATTFDILKTVQNLIEAGQSPYGGSVPKPLEFTAVWDRKTETADVGGLKFSLDYLEIV